jgi:hypothetical protein
VFVTEGIEQGISSARVIHNDLRFLLGAKLTKLALLAEANGPEFPSLTEERRFDFADRALKLL